MRAAFFRAGAFNGDISLWNTHKVTDLNSMFSRASKFNGDISRWNTNHVTGMQRMFQRASNFNADISKWNTARVTSMLRTFSDASRFNADISKWNTARVSIMSYMLKGAESFCKPYAPKVSLIRGGLWSLFQRTWAFQMYDSCCRSCDGYGFCSSLEKKCANMALQASTARCKDNPCRAEQCCIQRQCTSISSPEAYQPRSPSSGKESFTAFPCQTGASGTTCQTCVSSAHRTKPNECHSCHQGYFKRDGRWL